MKEAKGQERQLLAVSSITWIMANIIHAVTPTHFIKLKLPSHIFGTSYGVMVFAIFLTAPIWGSLGDRGKRIEMLSLSTLLYGIIQIMFGQVKTLAGVILFRALAGAAASGYNVGLMSMLVDITTDENRNQIMAKYAAVMSISQALGFLLGGILGFLPSQYVFLIQGIAMILMAIYMKKCIRPTNPEALGQTYEKPKYIWNIVEESRNNKELFTSWVKIFLAITFFVGIAYSGYNNAFGYYLKAELDFKPIVNGIWKAATGLVGLICNMTINIWLIKNTDTKRSIIYLLALNTVFAFLVFFNKSIVLFFVFSFLFFTNYTIQVPILQGFAVEGSDGDAGYMSGLFNAFKYLGEMIGAVGAGFIYNLNSKAPFLLGAVAILFAFLLSFINRLSVDKN